jgi:hypothetical protein
MKAMLVWPAMALLSASIAACGNAGERTPSTSHASSGAVAEKPSAVSSAASSGSYLKDDGDKDSDDELHKSKHEDDEDDSTLWAPYGGKVSEVTLRAVAAQVRAYYAAAAAGDGGKACALLYRGLASGLGESPSQANRAGTSACASTVAHIFKERHQQLAGDEVATMVVTAVRRKGDLGLALLGFKKAREGAILVKREAGVWKIASLLDSEIP